MTKTKSQERVNGKPDCLAQKTCKKELQIRVFDPSRNESSDVTDKVRYRIEKKNREEWMRAHPTKNSLIPGTFPFLRSDDRSGNA